MSYSIELNTKIVIDFENCNFQELTFKFLFALRTLFSQFIEQCLLMYFEDLYAKDSLSSVLKVSKVGKKSTSKRTKFKTLFGDIWVSQIQVRVEEFDGSTHQMSITRLLLGVSPKYQIPDFMKELLGFVSALSSFRVGHKIVSLFTNFKCSLMSVWHSVRFAASKIKLELSPEGTNEFEADATGVPTNNSGKRGSELKKVFQRKENGKLQLVGLTIGKYKNKADWLEAFSEIKVAIDSGLETFRKIILASDGELSIINSAKSISKKIKIQKDKWHVFHQLKYYLWKDGIKKEQRSNIISYFYKISMLSKLAKRQRNNRIKRYIRALSLLGYKHTAVYLQSAMEGFYTHEEEGNKNIYTTKTERSMRTTNQRINVGVWSDKGALNICKIRGAYYYNGIIPSNWKNKA